MKYLIPLHWVPVGEDKVDVRLFNPDHIMVLRDYPEGETVEPHGPMKMMGAPTRHYPPHTELKMANGDCCAVREKFDVLCTRLIEECGVTILERTDPDGLHEGVITKETNDPNAN